MTDKWTVMTGRLPSRNRGKKGMWLGVLCLTAVAAAGIVWMRSRGNRNRPAVLPEVSEKHVQLGELSDPRIVVEKSARRLTVWDGPRKVKSYRIGLGWGTGDKTREGDGCTPEGEFYLCTKNPQSRYTLSMGISYPNVEDAQRGLRGNLISRAEHDRIVEAISKRRQPPWKTDLGGEIMIHGCGGGRDWTAGCMAMDDEAIAELYAAMKLGTPVKIVP